MPTTTRGYPYPNNSDPADVPADIQALAAAIDLDVTGLGTWTSYTPGWRATVTDPVIGNGTLTGRYRNVGKAVDFFIRLVAGTTTTFGSGTYDFDLPPLTAATSTVFVAVASDVSAGLRWAGAGFSSAGGTVINRVVLTSGSGGINPTTPFTWASTDFLYINGTYETT